MKILVVHRNLSSSQSKGPPPPGIGSFPYFRESSFLSRSPTWSKPLKISRFDEPPSFQKDENFFLFDPPDIKPFALPAYSREEP